jgi:hypothetical protein
MPCRVERYIRGFSQSELANDNGESPGWGQV